MSKWLVDCLGDGGRPFFCAIKLALFKNIVYLCGVEL